MLKEFRHVAIPVFALVRLRQHRPRVFDMGGLYRAQLRRFQRIWNGTKLKYMKMINIDEKRGKKEQKEKK